MSTTSKPAVTPEMVEKARNVATSIAAMALVRRHAEKMHVIERRNDGYRPTVMQIANVLRQARKLGFRTDWMYCGVLEDGSLSFGNPGGVNLIVVKKRGALAFMPEREYLAR